MPNYIIERRAHPQVSLTGSGWAYVVIVNPDIPQKRQELATFIDPQSDQADSAQTRANGFLDRLLEGPCIVRTVKDGKE